MTAAPDKSASWDERLLALSWSESDITPLRHALAALGPGRITRLSAGEVHFIDREGQRWMWRKGRCLVKEDL